jgi:hypothetical protein
MDEYTSYRDADGWIESDIRAFVNYFLPSEMACALAFGNRMRMFTWAHDTHKPPECPYTRAVSAHSRVI